MSKNQVRQDSWAAYCEDYDDDDDEEEGEDQEEVTTPLANVSIKRVVAATVTKRASYERRRTNDSSVSSRDSSMTGADTNTNSSLSRRDMDTSAVERKPAPYAYSQRPDARRRSSSHARDIVVDSLPRKQQEYYVHKRGECYVCDKYGSHVPEEARKSRDMPAPSSPKASRQAHTVEAPPRPPRRVSSARTSRPLSMYGTPQFNYQPVQATNMMQYAAPPMSPAGWTTPVTPTVPYSPAFSYAPAVMATTYVNEPSYFERKPLGEIRPAGSNRRSSVYGDAIVRQSKADTRPKEPQKLSSTRDHAHSNSNRTVRANDHDLMPPPPRPTEIILAHRPSIKKSATYNTPLSINTNRRPQESNIDEAYIRGTDVPSLSRDRRLEPSRPPSSYRGPAEGMEPRPSNRKSASYSTPTQTTNVSSSPLPPIPNSLPRRSTTTATSTETRRVVDAEAYQAQRRSLTSNELTAEALQSLKQRNPSSRSETSSHRSHHTKSSSSAGGKSKRSNSEIKMTINGVNVSIPASKADQNISISTGKDGDVNISLGGREDQDGNGPRTSSQKKIERAPSTASRVSSKSIGSKERERERERNRDRETDLEQYERQRRQSDASRSRSRADAMRRSHDRDRDSPNPWGD